jgi:hypothetical protein
MKKNVSDTPRFIAADYEATYSEPYVKVRQYGQDWYLGKGVRWEDHPLKGYIPKYRWGNCESENVKIIAAQWCVSYASGDQYFDCELICADCGKYTQYSYAD